MAWLKGTCMSNGKLSFILILFHSDSSVFCLQLCRNFTWNHQLLCHHPRNGWTSHSKNADKRSKSMTFLLVDEVLTAHQSRQNVVKLQVQRFYSQCDSSSISTLCNLSVLFMHFTRCRLCKNTPNPFTFPWLLLNYLCDTCLCFQHCVIVILA